MNRREILQRSAAMAAIGSGLFAPSRVRAREPLTAVFFDPRFKASQRFAETQAGRGATMLSVEDDVMRQWRALLKKRKPGQELRIGGLTQYSELLITRANGREAGLRLRFHAEQKENGDALHCWLIA
jgi:hypothetical protein